MPTVDQHIAKLDVEMVAGQGRAITFVDLLATTSTVIGDWTAVANGTALAVSASGNDVVVTWSDALATSTIGRTWRLRLSGDDKIGGRVVEARPQATAGDETVAVTLTDPVEVTVTVAGVAVGAVDSVNGETGVVTLSAADVGADASGTAASAVSSHAAAVDPHGDRAYAAGLVDDLPDLVAGNGIDLTPVGDTLVVSQQGADVQDFSTVGTATWTKPAGATLIMAYVLGGGGGGGAGRKGAEGALRHGGCGGQAGSAVVMILPASSVSNTVTVTVGDGGAGAPAQTTNSTDGTNGTAGSASSFGSYAAANGGSGGLGGNAAGYSAYTAAFHPASQWPAGFSGLNADSGTTLGPPSGGNGHAGGGGAGGYRTAANANSLFIGIGGLGAGNLTAPSGSGAAGNAGSTIYGGTGGNGGLASGSGNATGGGAGGAPSGGGGGGGAAVNSVGNSGAGGKGGKGFVRVVTLR